MAAKKSRRDVNPGHVRVRSLGMDAASMEGLRSAETGPGLPRAFAVETGRPFEEFYRAEVAGLVALARALCPPSTAEDIAQEAMLVAYRRWPSIQALDSPEAYVRRTCANMAVSQFRRRMAEVRALGRTRRQLEALADPDHEAFWALVRTLPRRQAQAVALHYLYDLSVADIAVTLGIVEGSVKTHVSRARETLARQVGGNEEDRP